MFRVKGCGLTVIIGRGFRVQRSLEIWARKGEGRIGIVSMNGVRRSARWICEHGNYFNTEIYPDCNVGP